MSKRKSKRSQSQTSVPVVRLSKPAGRPIQLRYFCPNARREIRTSTGTRDETEAEEQKEKLQAQLLLGLNNNSSKRQSFGPDMDWDEFRDLFSSLHLSTIRDSSAAHSESRLDLAERIIRPRTLGDMSDPTTLQQLQSKLLEGAESRRGMPRSPHTVKGYINSILVPLNWAYLQGWLQTQPRLRKLKVGKLKVMKGRPITAKEFERMLEKTESVVGNAAADSWGYVLRGLWESALRIDELMHMSWDKLSTIQPIWEKGRLPILDIPADMQKNETEENIPMLPWFESVLLETPPEKRMGWIFRPMSLQHKMGRKVRHVRLNTEWVGKVIARIGKEAEIVVVPSNERTGHPVKHATAHDLRRSCGERLRNAGVPPLVICRVMRHSSWETTRKHYAPGDIQKDAEVLHATLNKEKENAD